MFDPPYLLDDFTFQIIQEEKRMVEKHKANIWKVYITWFTRHYCCGFQSLSSINVQAGWKLKLYTISTHLFLRIYQDWKLEIQILIQSSLKHTVIKWLQCYLRFGWDLTDLSLPLRTSKTYFQLTQHLQKVNMICNSKQRVSYKQSYSQFSRYFGQTAWDLTFQKFEVFTAQ